MAGPDSKKDLKQVLRHYQNSSINSLQGPGLIDCNKKVQEDCLLGLPVYGLPKALLCSESLLKRPPDDTNSDCKNCNVKDDIWRPPTPKAEGIAPIVQHKSPRHVAEDIPISNPAARSSNTEHRLDKNIDVNIKSTDKIWVGPSSDSRGSVEPGVFLAPPPFPPQPWPVLAVPDQGLACPEAGRGETILGSEQIACFSIGGEKRLCLPQILYTVLGEFSLAQINTVCDELHIYCSRCTMKQLEILKNSGVLPPIANSCGLITKTDAQRLNHHLIHLLNAPRVPNTARNEKQQGTLLKVSHNCFGKCKGVVWSEQYNSASDPCIECLECHLMFAPDRFVCHAHKNLENSVCHWGFDSENWRSYLMLSKDQSMDFHKAELELEMFKNKFDLSASGNHKRKQVVEVKGELVKKVRGDDAQLQYDASYDELMSSFIWRTYPNMPPWTATPILMRDGKPVPPPPAAFIRDSVPAPVPSYLIQGPPVLVDPALVVPLSETEKFERHYQPNVALAPPKVRDKLAREAAAAAAAATAVCVTENAAVSSSISSPTKQQHVATIQDCTSNKRAPYQKSSSSREDIEEVVVVKIEESLSHHSVVISPTNHDRLNVTTKSQLPPILSPNRVNQKTPQRRQFQTVPSELIQPSVSPRKTFSPDTSTFHPDLELSTTDSETESAVSVVSKSEIVEEAEALLRGWSDRAAAAKVHQIVDNIAHTLSTRGRQYTKEAREKSELKHKFEMQTRQLANSKEEQELNKKKILLLEAENKALRENLMNRNSAVSLITVKTEPLENGTC